MTTAKKASFKLCSEQKDQGRGKSTVWSKLSGCSIGDDGKAELPTSALLLLSPQAKECGAWQGMGPGQLARWEGS